jgi:hypothetical protein
MRNVCRSFIILFALLTSVSSTWGLDHFLTIGGGYNPSGNQISLEKNVLMFQQLLFEQRPQGVPHDIFFADGDAPTRDLQFADPSYHIPKANQLLARLVKEENDLGYQYRSHQVPGVRGASTRENLDRWFLETGSKLSADDRLVIYLTGHGGKGPDPKNTYFYLWNRERISVREFTAMLDKIPANVPVVMVMVQCYSGGFANTIFNEGQNEKGVTAANRCGFFATVQDRTAAGCTPDIVEENYKEFSSYFWAAIRGKTRAGEAINPPDIDLDGRVSFAEAHAYALLTSDTIDISVKTSDAFLRAISRQTGKEPGLVTAEAPYAQLIACATPVDRAVLDGLSKQLGLNGSQRAQEAQKLADDIKAQIRSLDNKRSRDNRPFESARNTVLAECKVRWPELANHWDPKVYDLLHDEGDQVVATIEGHPKYSEFDRLHDEMEANNTRKLDLERKWVKTQRLLRVIENITLSANLKIVSSVDAQTRYQKLVDLEASTL